MKYVKIKKGDITLKAQFYAGLKSIERELPGHYAQGPYYAENWEDCEARSAEFIPGYGQQI